ncbi:MAG: hypothetical protein K9N23_08505 [Akkermansiaceae bacterium]|nr:hypothetical protein [Akkermansiaceae bacterium]
MKSALATVPIFDSPRKPSFEPPSIRTLAMIAATMSSPDEDPDITALRAVELWRACQCQLPLIEDEYAADSCFEPTRLRRLEEADAFIAACGKTRTDIMLAQSGATGKGGHVKFDTFLDACKPSPGTKKVDIIVKWREFINHEIERKRPKLTTKERSDMSGSQMEQFRTHGIPTSRLLDYGTSFKRFLKADRAASRSARGKKGGRPKKSLEP